MPTNPHALIPDSELALLRELVGNYATTFLLTPSEAFIEFGGMAMCFTPEDEVGRSPANERQEVVRIRAAASQTDPNRSVHISDTEGAIESAVVRVDVLRCLVVFEAPSAAPAGTLLGAEIPAGVGYDVQLYHPAKAATDPLAKAAAGLGMANTVDCGVHLEFASGQRLVIATNGWAYFLNWAFAREAEEWAARCERVPINGS